VKDRRHVREGQVADEDGGVHSLVPFALLDSRSTFGRLVWKGIEDYKTIWCVYMHQCIALRRMSEK
jgi:hypothetical protein